ncbi:MAG: B-box zinc finger protein [Lachnospiraceae bacterium]
MKCYYHGDREAVAQCTECGKALCRECADIYSPVLCNECAGARNADNKMQLVKDSILCVGMMIVGGWFYFSMVGGVGGGNLLSALLVIILFGGVPFGWEALNKIQPGIFLIMPIIGWVIYFMIKLTLAFLIGWLFFVVRIGKIIYGALQAKKMEDYINDQNEKV